MKSLQIPALALPVADSVVHKIELRQAAEVCDGKDRRKYRLQTGVIPFLREKMHLQKTAVGLPLYLDQIRDWKFRADFRKIDPFADVPIILLFHRQLLLGTAEKQVCGRRQLMPRT
jgi:hypothetical protein